MGISMVRSLLGRSTGNMSPGAGNGGDTESFEGGFSKIVSRVKSSLALASPMGNGKSVVLNGNNDAVRGSTRAHIHTHTHIYREQTRLQCIYYVFLYVCTERTCNLEMHCVHVCVH